MLEEKIDALTTALKDNNETNQKLIEALQASEASRTAALEQFEKTAGSKSGSSSTGKSTGRRSSSRAKKEEQPAAEEKTEASEPAPEEKTEASEPAAEEKTEGTDASAAAETSTPAPRESVDAATCRALAAEYMNVQDEAERKSRLERVRAGLNHIGEKKASTITDENNMRRLCYYLDLWIAGYPVDFEKADEDVMEASGEASGDDDVV